MEQHETWRVRAACRGMGPAFFYPERGHNNQSHRAKAVCATCTVRAECYEEVLTIQPGGPDDFGIWGGTTSRDRDGVRTARAVA